MQESELYMKPALLDIFGMPKDRDCIIYKKNTLFPLIVKSLFLFAHLNSLEFLIIFTDRLIEHLIRFNLKCKKN